MEKITKALLISMSYYELWGDDVIDPDIALGALESISAELEGATPDEIKAIYNVSRQLAKQARSEEEREFYENFIEDFGLES